MHVTGWNIYDTFERNPQPVLIESLALLEIKAYDVIERIVKRNAAAGKTGEDAYRCVAIHRQKGIHRHFNLCTRNKKLVDRGLPAIAPYEYGGALSLAEALIDGTWRLATLDEEKACHALDLKETAEAKKADIARLAAKQTLSLPEDFIPAMAGAVAEAVAANTAADEEKKTNNK